MCKLLCKKSKKDCLIFGTFTQGNADKDWSQTSLKGVDNVRHTHTHTHTQHAHFRPAQTHTVDSSHMVCVCVCVCVATPRGQVQHCEECVGARWPSPSLPTRLWSLQACSPSSRLLQRDSGWLFVLCSLRPNLWESPLQSTLLQVLNQTQYENGMTAQFNVSLGVETVALSLRRLMFLCGGGGNPMWITCLRHNVGCGRAL